MPGDYANNPAEKRLKAVLRRAGATGVGVPEAGYRENVQATGHYRGRFVWVHAADKAAWPPRLENPQPIKLGATRAQLYTRSEGAAVRFTCSGLTYDVISVESSDRFGGSRPAPVKTFAARLATSLDC